MAENLNNARSFNHERLEFPLRRGSELSLFARTFDPSVKRLRFVDLKRPSHQGFNAAIRQDELGPPQTAPNRAHKVRDVLYRQVGPVITIDENEAPVLWMAT